MLPLPTPTPPSVLSLQEPPLKHIPFPSSHHTTWNKTSGTNPGPTVPFHTGHQEICDLTLYLCALRLGADSPEGTDWRSSESFQVQEPLIFQHSHPHKAPNATKEAYAPKMLQAEMCEPCRADVRRGDLQASGWPEASTCPHLCSRTRGLLRYAGLGRGACGKSQEENKEGRQFSEINKISGFLASSSRHLQGPHL